MEGQVRVWPRPFLCRGRVAGVLVAWPSPGGLGRRVVVRVRHHGMPRLAHMRWVSVACAGQLDALPVSVPDRQALAECVARSRFVGLYEGVLLGKVGSPGVAVVDGRLRSRWFDTPCQVLRREGVWWAGHTSAAWGGERRSGVFMRVCSMFQLAVAQGSGGGLHAPHEGAAEGTENLCTRAACGAWASVSVRTSERG